MKEKLLAIYLFFPSVGGKFDNLECYLILLPHCDSLVGSLEPLTIRPHNNEDDDDEQFDSLKKNTL